MRDAVTESCILVSTHVDIPDVRFKRLRRHQRTLNADCAMCNDHARVAMINAQANFDLHVHLLLLQSGLTHATIQDTITA